MDAVLTEVSQRINNALVHLQKELSSIRAGRANPTLIEEVPVNAYGGRMKLMEVGTISAPQPTLLTVNIWDASVVKDVEKALMEANLGLNPAVDGTTIRLAIPPLNEERRQEFVKLAHQKGEAARIELRQIRQDIREDWKKEEESGEISEDELHRREKLLQDLLDKSMKTIDEYVDKKEEELMQV